MLVLEGEIERRIGAAARVAGIDPAEFIVRAIQQRCAEVLGETRHTGDPATGVLQNGARWAIRPTESRALRSIAEASGIPIEAIVGPGRARAASRARAVAAYLLRNDAGLSASEIARILHRSRPTVTQLIARVARVVGSSDLQADLLERARRSLKNGINSGMHYPPPPLGTGARKLLPGLLPCRLAIGLTQPELAQRAGVARETLARLERLRRPARPETVVALQQALSVSIETLTTGTADLPMRTRSPQ